MRKIRNRNWEKEDLVVLFSRIPRIVKFATQDMSLYLNCPLNRYVCRALLAQLKRDRYDFTELLCELKKNGYNL